MEFWSLDNGSSKSILDVLETIYLIFWKTVVQRVTVVKLGVYDGGGTQATLSLQTRGQGSKMSVRLSYPHAPSQVHISVLQLRLTIL